MLQISFWSEVPVQGAAIPALRSSPPAERLRVVNRGHDPGRSSVRRVLGRRMFARCKAARVPGLVAWCNFDLARQLGFRVPASNRMTPGLHEQLVAALSYQILRRGEVVAHRPWIHLDADRYGGEGLGLHRGSARGAFHPRGDMFLKGIGPTPLCRNDPDDYYHSHGGAHMWHGLFVAALSEVCTNLFTNGSTRILAIVDQGDDTVYPSGERRRPQGDRSPHRQSSSARAYPGGTTAGGSSPVHDLPGDGARDEPFVLAGKGRSARARPDLRATMLRIIDDHARTAAAHARWRLTHSSISPSNLQLDGALLDLPQARANPRCVPLLPEYGLDYESVPRTDYMDRADALQATYNKLRNSMAEPLRRRLNAQALDVPAELDAAYLHHLTLQLLCATGIKRAAAERIQRTNPPLARRFAEVVMSLSNLRNPASVRKLISYSEQAAVVDVFGLLGAMPRLFDAPGGQPRAGDREAPSPGVSGEPLSRRDAPEALSHPESRARGSLWGGHGRLSRGGAAVLWQRGRDAGVDPGPRGIREPSARTALLRAAAGMCSGRRRRVSGLIGMQTPCARPSTPRWRGPCAASKHCYVRGTARELDDGGVELQVCTVAGLRYSLRAWNDRAQKRRLHVEISLRKRRGGVYQADLPGEPCLTRRQLGALRYTCSTDGWQTTVNVHPGRLQGEGRSRAVMAFAGIRPSGPYGTLEGYFYDGRDPGFCIRDSGDPFRGYAFAVPDRFELRSILARGPRPR